jgi:hypothetical protein
MLQSLLCPGPGRLRPTKKSVRSPEGENGRLQAVQENPECMGVKQNITGATFRQRAARSGVILRAARLRLSPSPCRPQEL